jgi:hypothetical protein
MTTISQYSVRPAVTLPGLFRNDGGPGTWEAGFYGLFAAAVALAITFPFVPIASVVIVCTLGAGASAAMAWLLFALQRDRSNLVRLIIVSCVTAVLFIVSPLPVWVIVSSLYALVDPGLAMDLKREGLAVGILMIGVVIGAPLVFALSFIGTAMYWVLRNLWILVWYGFDRPSCDPRDLPSPRHIQDCAGHVGGGVRQQPQHRRRRFVGAADALQRDRRGDARNAVGDA